MDIDKITRDLVDYWGRYNLDYLVEILRGEYPLAEAQEDILSLLPAYEESMTTHPARDERRE
tara:strand:- start:514 stop:699 length:186 start_codon:yes stop_codon:yes gene_type:complete